MAPRSFRFKPHKYSMATTEYTLSDNAAAVPAKKSRRHHHRRGNSTGTEGEEESSLTYSAGSSIASSAAGESTDSSFADIMRVLDVQDSNELAQFMKKEGNEIRYNKSARSVASNSLAYSTDGESALEGAHLLSTITGRQPSDSYGPDGGGAAFHEEPFDNILFAPADAAPEVKRKSSKSSRNGDDYKQKKSPKSHKKKGHRRTKSNSSKRSDEDKQDKTTPPGSRKSTPRKTHKISRSNGSAASSEKGPATPPPPVPRKTVGDCEGCDDDDEVWYAKWWMCGFADSFRDLVPKR